ncbi:MAG: division/cell wall cluster transcriptional repressor MraZ [Acidobacteriota bacterium]
MFRGSAATKIDDKGRLKLPSDLRRQLEERYGADVFVTSLRGESALLYPLNVWEAIEARLAALPTSNRARQRFVERVNYFGQQARLDAQGRLLMPQILRDRADISGEVVISGRLDHLEIWNRERFDRRLDEAPLTDDDLDALAEAGV